MATAKLEGIPEIKYTSVDEIKATVDTVRNTFLSHKTRPLEWRLVQLRKLYWGLKDNEKAIAEACKKDLGKSSFETYMAESGWCQNDIVFITKNLAKWMKDESAPDIALMNKALSPKIKKDPLGVVLVIGAYNFPFQLSLGPFIGAIAAGCSAVLKPSENAPAAAAVMEHIVKNYLDPTAYTVVQGAIPETTRLLEQKWDKIFYTGNATVGTIVAKKAAETLTPVTLELGGRNPAIITKNADPRLAARRLLWAKVMNAGQVCVSQNWILVDKEILPAFITELKATVNEFFPNGAQKSPDYGRIVNNRQWSRLKKMLDESKGKILMGGTMDEADNFLEPTVVQVDDVKDTLLIDESFGPLIPVYAVSDLDEAIRLANDIHDTPLGVYPFGNKQETDKVLAQVRSGGASVNDGFYHASIPTLAFGGVGSSGSGSYRGRASFDCFTHRRSVTTTPGWMEGLLAVRYPPYAGKLGKYKKISELKPNFDRNGKAKGGLLSLLFGGKGLGLFAILGKPEQSEEDKAALKERKEKAAKEKEEKRALAQKEKGEKQAAAKKEREEKKEKARKEKEEREAQAKRDREEKAAAASTAAAADAEKQAKRESKDRPGTGGVGTGNAGFTTPPEQAEDKEPLAEHANGTATASPIAAINGNANKPAEVKASA